MKIVSLCTAIHVCKEPQADTAHKCSTTYTHACCRVKEACASYDASLKRRAKVTSRMRGSPPGHTTFLHNLKCCCTGQDIQDCLGPAPVSNMQFESVMHSDLQNGLLQNSKRQLHCPSYIRSMQNNAVNPLRRVQQCFTPTCIRRMTTSSGMPKDIVMNAQPPAC